MSTSELKELLITLKEFGVTEYKDQHVAIKIAEVHQPVRGASALDRQQSAARAEASEGRGDGEALRQPASRTLPHALRKINPAYFDPSLGITLDG